MNKLILSLVLGFSLSSAFAVEDDPKVLFVNKLKINAEVSEKTVRCSAVGYGAIQLKINLHELKGRTIFDHSNSRFGEFSEPCMTAGFCVGFGHDRVFTIEDIIQSNPRVEQIEVIQTVSSSQRLVDSEGPQRCVKTLFEDLKTVIGDIEFHHQRQGQIESLPEKACTE